MHWADELVTKIPHKDAKHRVDDMKTVSGMPHVGSLRAIVTHDILYKAMQYAGFTVDFTYVFNDMDPMDGLPVYLDEATYRPHMGKPLYRIPSPEPGFESFGKYYATKYQEAFNTIGCHPQVMWSHELYASGKMDPIVRTALDNADKIREIYHKVAGYNKPKGWVPYQVICPKCGKLGTTLVTDWDGTYVSYECKPDLVTWAQGCGHTGKVEPTGENGKLMWKVDWPAHWKAMEITVECAGKDHFSDGGSRDIGAHICREVFKTDPPTGWMHEFFLIGGSKMSSSKGAGIAADKVTTIIPPQLIRFIIARTPIKRAANLDPGGMTIPDLFDDYDEAEQAFWHKSDPVLARSYELSQVDEAPPTPYFQPRFRDVATFIQHPEIDLFQKFTEVKGSELTEYEKNVLEDRVKFAQIWLDSYAPPDAVFTPTKEIPEAARQLTAEQHQYLAKVIELISNEWKEPEELQQVLYQTAKDMGLHPKDAFTAVYVSLIGKDHGPRAAWLLLEHKDTAITRFQQIISKKTEESTATARTSDKTKLLSIDPALAEKYPTITIGYALIEGVTITKSDPALQQESEAVLRSLATLTTEQLGEYPEVTSYRRLYKEMGIDWHSRRPSPEALLRRIALKKGLYSVNTCVDAYNLVVLQNRVSSGAFDADTISFPSRIQIAAGGEKILLLGDDEETTLKAGEISYFDQNGPYNLDYNYRDAQRTKVTEKTKNLWINIDGIYDITPEQVKKTLEETIAIIQKYCGGTVKEKGLLYAEAK